MDPKKEFFDDEHDELDEASEPVMFHDQQVKAESRRDERFVAFHLVYAVDRFDYSVEMEEVIESFAHGFNVMIPTDSFAVQLARGAIEHRDELDEQLKPFLKNWKLERLGCCTKLILRMSLWEMKQPGAIASIVINEAVELAKAFAEKDAYKFINGILDEIAKKIFGIEVILEDEKSE